MVYFEAMNEREKRTRWVVALVLLASALLGVKTVTDASAAAGKIHEMPECAYDYASFLIFNVDASEETGEPILCREPKQVR